MKLYIDTRDNQKTIVSLDEVRLEKPTGYDKSQQVLSLIDEILTKQNKKLEDISEIKVETGAGLPTGRQGSFTGLRVGTAVANALGFVLKIPVNGQIMVEPKYREGK